MLIFDQSCQGRRIESLRLTVDGDCEIPQKFLREQPPKLPEVSELQVVRHFTRLSQKNFAIDSHFYPLGSCTMKYNPKSVHRLAMAEDCLGRHPLANESLSQGYLQCAYELQEILKVITGMHSVCLTPMAGAQGEFVGIAMIRSFHQAKGDLQRNEILVPDSAHGTNPASAAMCGFVIKEIPTSGSGELDLEALQQAVSDRTAGMMLTYPSTLGIFESDILKVTEIIHLAGGLMYYDGANLNAILGKVKPADLGFDVMHMNLHKTFATPHGGGGPGAGPVACVEKLTPFLPIPRVAVENNQYTWVSQERNPDSIGRLSCFMGNAGVILRAYYYLRLLGREGLSRVSTMAVLNANYLMNRLKKAGFTLAYPKKLASHEFIITFKHAKRQWDISAFDFAKRLLDKGVHAPTVYFPLVIPECWLIEPTETETKATLDDFVEIMVALLNEANTQPEHLRHAPHTLPIGRLDEVTAAKTLCVVHPEIK